MAESGFSAAGESAARWMWVNAFASVPDAGSFAGLARDWLAPVSELLAPREWAEALKEEKPPFTGMPEEPMPDFDAWAEPFMVYGLIHVAPLKWNGMRSWHRRLTRKNLEWLDGALADRPVSARIEVFRADANGVTLPGHLEVSAEADLGPQGELVPAARLSVFDSFLWRPGARPQDVDGLRARQAEVAREWAGRARLTGLYAGPGTVWDGTALMYSLRPQVRWWEAALQPGLHGYSWLMLCPAEAVARLGGAAALAGSGAFWQVLELPGGAVLLQATERMNDYDLAAARRVFEVVAPVLPPGWPRKPHNWLEDVPWLVIPQSAAVREEDPRA